MKILLQTLLITFLASANIFADDIWFISPQPGQPVTGKLTIQIQPPYQPTDVRVWIKEDMGPDRLVWSGSLTAARNYTMTVDTSKFRPGKYELKAEYYINGQDFDGDMDFWINGPAGTAPAPGGNGTGNPNTGTYY
ncbi:MAG: hypothetical protein ACRCTQ_02640 [Brevinemataceae bacterium]